MGPEPETWRDGWTAGDQTGGYENEMREILRAMAAAGQRNVIFIATDVHCSFVYRYLMFFAALSDLSPSLAKRNLNDKFHLRLLHYFHIHCITNMPIWWK
jgi:hypothetical protein